VARPHTAQRLHIACQTHKPAPDHPWRQAIVARPSPSNPRG
jgi:hypothetical protein